MMMDKISCFSDHTDENGINSREKPAARQQACYAYSDEEDQYGSSRIVHAELSSKKEEGDLTLRYYEDHTEQFVDSTLSADMSLLQERFLKELPAGAFILDFGCGSGRDTLAFLKRGYHVEAADGSEKMCRAAEAMTGIPVKHMLFQELDACGRYDGIWACASILHLPKEELAAVFHKMAAALKSGGVIYTGFKYGTFEGTRNGRFFTDLTEESLEELVKQIPGLHIKEWWITSDVRPGRGEEKWLNTLIYRD